MEVMIYRDQGHYFPGSKARLIWKEVMIYPYGLMIDRDRGHDKSGLKSLMIRDEVMIYPYGSHD
jgi:hypothetical protein